MMVDAAALAAAISAVAITGIVSHAFHSWLRQRERERLTATDKAELLDRIKAFDGKMLELKNTIVNARRG